MANTPPMGILKLVAQMRQMVAGIDEFVGGGGVWPGPEAARVAEIALTLETLNTQTESAYAAYREKKASRDDARIEAALPIFREVVVAAYLVFGRNSEGLRELGLAPLAVRGISRLPAAPPGLDATEVSSSSVLVDWTPVPSADRYHVYFGMDLSAMELFGSATKSALRVSGLTEGTKYFFYVTSVNSAGESAPSNFTTRRTL